MKQRRWLAPLMLLTCLLLVGVTTVASTLRRGPVVQQPKQIQAAYTETGFAETLSHLNSCIAGPIAEEHLDTTYRADNLAIARRISLGLIGSGMSLEELRALQQVPRVEQIRWWTSYLLEDRRWSDYFAERFARAIVGTNNGPFLLFRRGKFKRWLSDELQAGTGYDEIVRAMIESEGLWTDTPQVNFVTATMDEANEGRADPVRLAGRTARVFLAQRIDCVQCHDDFLGELDFGIGEDYVAGQQRHFHELAAFYSGTAVADPVFAGIVEDGEAYEAQLLSDTQPRQLAAKVPFLQALLPDKGKPRQRLAKWITHPDNIAFARATVNRVWALMFSRPMVQPVDSIPLDDSVPAALDVLAIDFAKHGYDMRRLIRLIVESEAFQRASRADFAITPEHENRWAVFPITQLRPDQVAGSLFQGCKLTAIDEDASIFTKLRIFGDAGRFMRRYGDRGEDEFEGSAVTIPQRLLMMNGNLVTERTKNDLVSNAATRIATLVSNDQQAIKLAYLSVLNRQPSGRELEVFQSHLNDKRGSKRQSAMGDLFWALINSTEFSWNH